MSGNKEVDSDMVKIIFYLKNDITLKKKKRYILLRSDNFIDACIFEENG